MATAQIDARMKAAGGAAKPKNSRRNEIVAIALFALSALMALCLVSYNPNDPSWVSAGAQSARNWTGRLGANVAAALFQSFGLAAALLPVLLTATAWRRFRTQRIHAPLSRVIGLVTITVASAALLSLYVAEPLVDRSFNAGGFVGVLVAETLKGVLNTVGATIMLAAVAAVGLLLATNFSFVAAYERTAAALANPSGAFRKTVERFNAWRAARRAQALARAEARREAKAAREREAEAQRLAEQEAVAAAQAAAATITVKREAKADAPSAAAAIKRSAAAREKPSREDEIRAQLAQAEAELASILVQPANADAQASPSAAMPTASRKKREAAIEEEPPIARRVSVAPESSAPAKEKTRETPDVSDMMSTAAVVRTEPDAEEDDDMPFERLVADEKAGAKSSARESARRSEVASAVALLDYKFPPLEFLNAAPPRREQADEELLQIAQRVAEKCKEFNVTGQIKHICPGPVVTTYEFKPDPGVKYSRVTGLVDDLCIALEAESVRIDRLPGKPHVGIEVPNPERETIFLRDVLESRPFRESESKLTLALGKTIDGINYVADLTRMQH